MMDARFKLNPRIDGSKRGLTVAGIALLLAVILIIVAAKLYGVFSASTSEAQLEANQELADDIANQVAAVIAPYRTKLAALAKQERIAAALRGGDSAALTALAAAAQTEFAGAERLRILPSSAIVVDTTGSPPLTYASIDMLRKAREGTDEIPAEFHLGGTPQEHIVIIERVVAGGELLGFLHLSLGTALVRDELARNPPADVHVEVRQPVHGGRPGVLGGSGEAPSDDAPPAIAGVRGTRWVVALRPSRTDARAGGLGVMRLAGLAVLLVVVAAGLFRVFGKRFERGVAATDVVYQGAIKAIMEGAVPGLERLLPGAPGGQGIPSDVEPLSKGLEGEDITRFDVTGGTADPEHPTMPEPAGETSGSPEEPDFVDLTEAPADEKRAVIPASIFRSYDIRGVFGDTLTDDGVYQIGRALGAEAEALGQQTVIVARDGRSSSPILKEALVRGLQESGRDVLDIGLTPTPVLYFATHYLDTHSGVMVTGSHNPPEYNGLKIVLDGQTLSGDAIQALRARVENQDFTSGQGTLQTTEIVPDYIRRVSEEIPVTLGDALKVVVDCGNAVPGIVAPHILRAIGHDIIELYCDVDPSFPHHHPDPSQPENLTDLIDMVREEEADLGLAFDGDGDRLGVVDSTGNIIWPDQQMMLFAQDVLARNPGAKIIYDVKCSRRLADVIRENGGEPIMCRTGHSLIKSKMQETGALLAGEMSGHIFFKERWYGFDDALYSAARLLDILVKAAQAPDEVFEDLPGASATPELRLDMPEDRHAQFMQQVMSAAEFDDGEVSTIDGLRVEFPNGWGLVRPSNTTPCLVLRFEGDDDAALENVKGRFRELLLKIDSNLDLPF